MGKWIIRCLNCDKEEKVNGDRNKVMDKLDKWLEKEDHEIEVERLE